MSQSNGQGSVPREGWRYVVLLAKFGNHLLQLGVMKSLGVLIPSLVVQLDSTYSTVGLLLSLHQTMYYMACPLAQMLISRYDVRCVSILGGLGTALPIISASFTKATTLLGVFFFMSGVSSSLLGQASTVLMRKHFGEHFGTANFISMMGSLVGGMLVPLLGAKLLDAFGLFGAFLRLGGLFLNCVPIGASLRPPRKTRVTRQPETHALSDYHDENCDTLDGNSRRHFATNKEKGSPAKRSFWMTLLLGLKLFRKEQYFTLFFLPCQMLCDIVFTGWVLFMVSYAISVGIDERFAVFLPVAAATGGLVSRVMLAFIMRFRSQWSPGIYALYAGLTGVTLLFYQLNSTLSHLLVCSFFGGFGMYGAACAFYVCISVIVTDNHFPGIIALSYFFSGIAAATAGVVTGYIYDVIKSFRIIFNIFGGMMFCVSSLAVTYVFVKRRRRSGASAAKQRALGYDGHQQFS
ncbi:monocarboxylate transporter 3-like [Diadema antillarum]|uniref:monocarboxylate transporter 3-like n=1 Tax=Diadema antillarum TaxID=105358 RepID=UPI003A8A5A9E